MSVAPNEPVERYFPHKIGPCPACGSARGTRTTDGAADYWECICGEDRGSLLLGPEP